MSQFQHFRHVNPLALQKGSDGVRGFIAQPLPMGIAAGGGKPLPGASPTPPPTATTDELPPPLLFGSL